MEYSKEFIRNFILVVSLVLIARLSYVAVEDNNWRGLIYSTLHIIIVGLAAYYALCRTNKKT